MISEFNAEAFIKSIVKKILSIFRIFMMACIDSKSLYDCLIKFEIMQKKRFMIDIMCLREIYEKRKITKIRRINGNDNSIDVMIKTKSCSALKRLININTVSMKVAE